MKNSTAYIIGIILSIVYVIVSSLIIASLGYSFENMGFILKAIIVSPVFLIWKWILSIIKKNKNNQKNNSETANTSNIEK